MQKFEVVENYKKGITITGMLLRIQHKYQQQN